MAFFANEGRCPQLLARPLFCLPWGEWTWILFHMEILLVILAVQALNTVILVRSNRPLFR